MATNIERVSSSVYLVDYFIYCPLLCEKEGQVKQIDDNDDNIRCNNDLGRKKNSLLLSIRCGSRSTNSNSWIL